MLKFVKSMMIKESKKISNYIMSHFQLFRKNWLNWEAKCEWCNLIFFSKKMSDSNCVIKLTINNLSLFFKDFFKFFIWNSSKVSFFSHSTVSKWCCLDWNQAKTWFQKTQAACQRQTRDYQHQEKNQRQSWDKIFLFKKMMSFLILFFFFKNERKKNHRRYKDKTKLPRNPKSTLEY